MKVWGVIRNSTKLLITKDSLYIKFTWIWATTAKVHTISFCCIIDAEGGVWSAVPSALEKPFSVFRELILTPLSHRDIYRPLDIFFPGRLEPDERGRLHWGISARSERWKRGRDVGAGRNVEEFQSSPFKRSLLLPFSLPSLSLHLSLLISVAFALLAWHERQLLPKQQNKRSVCCLCPSLPQYPPSSSSPPGVAGSVVYSEAWCLWVWNQVGVLCSLSGGWKVFS